MITGKYRGYMPEMIGSFSRFAPLPAAPAPLDYRGAGLVITFVKRALRRVSRADLKGDFERRALRKMKCDKDAVADRQGSLRPHQHQMVTARRKPHGDERSQFNRVDGGHFIHAVADARLVNADLSVVGARGTGQHSRLGAGVD